MSSSPSVLLSNERLLFKKSSRDHKPCKGKCVGVQFSALHTDEHEIFLTYSLQEKLNVSMNDQNKMELSQTLFLSLHVAQFAHDTIMLQSKEPIFNIGFLATSNLAYNSDMGQK